MSIPRSSLLMAGLAAICLIPSTTHAQWLGVSTGNYDYTAPGNWTDGIVNGQFSGNMTGNQSIRLSGDYTMLTGHSFTYTGNGNHNFRADGSVPGVATIADPATDTFTHADEFADGDVVRYNSTLNPGGLSTTGQYFVVNRTPTSFQLAWTPGGTPINFTSVGAGLQFFKSTRLTMGGDFTFNPATTGRDFTWGVNSANNAGLAIVMDLGGADRTFNVAADQVVNLNSVILGGTEKIVKTGAGTLVLNQTGTFTGGVDLDQGAVLVTSGASQTPFGGGPLRMAEGTTLASQGSTTRATVGGAVLNGDVNIGNGANTGALTLYGVVDLNGGDRVLNISATGFGIGGATGSAASGVNGGTNSLTVTGGGVLSFGGTTAGNVTLGALNIAEGGLLTRDGSSVTHTLGSGPITFGDNTTLVLANGNTLTNDIALDGTLTYLSGNNNNTTLSGRITGNNALNLAGTISTSATLNLGHVDNTFSGGLEILNNGTRNVGTSANSVNSYFVRAANAGSSFGTGAVTIGSTMTFTGTEAASALGRSVIRLASDQTLHGLASGTVAAQNTVNVISDSATFRTLTLDGTGTHTFAGIIGGTLANENNLHLAKTGSSIQILEGANTYLGDTTVTGGALIVDGSLAGGTVSIGNGARFGGSGSLGGDLTFGNGALFVFDPLATLQVAGTVSLDNGFGIASLVDLNGASLDWNAIDLGTYTLIDTASTFNNIANFGEGNAVSVGGGKSAYFENGSLRLVVIPEPTSLMLVGVALAALALLRRR